MGAMVNPSQDEQNEKRLLVHGRNRRQPKQEANASPFAYRAEMESDAHATERTGQRREPAADDVRFVSRAERLAPVRCTVLSN
jgi:hypothetical protein